MGKSTTEIAELAGCCVHTVRNVLHFERKYGVVNNPLAQAHSRPRSLDTGDIDYISSLIQANPVFIWMKSKIGFFSTAMSKSRLQQYLALYITLPSPIRRSHRKPRRGTSCCVQPGKQRMLTYPPNIVFGWMSRASTITPINASQDGQKLAELVFVGISSFVANDSLSSLHLLVMVTSLSISLKVL